MSERVVAALFVDSRGEYSDMVDVIPWDITKDARNYHGPHPVVAHPPCERYGRFAGDELGEDGGCFAAALRVVRLWGGVLEHPEGSHAWRMFQIARPSVRGWCPADAFGGWTCRVEQGHYGHRARKPTWLYAFGVERPDLEWGKSQATIGPRPGRDPVRERRIGAVQRMARRERAATPRAFAELLVAVARTAR